MDCLKDYIGIRHCSKEEPESGLYLNNLAGMSTELADKIANSEQGNFMGVWEDVQTRSFKRFVQDFQMYLFDTAKTGFNKTIYQTQRLTKARGYEVLDSLAVYRGVYVFLPVSRFVKFDLNSVQVYIKDVDGGSFDSGFDNGYEIDSSSLNSQIRIYDLQNERLVNTIDVVLKQGINTFPINLEFSLDSDAIELFICIDSTKITSIKTLDSLYGWYDVDCSFYPSWSGRIHGDEQAVVLPAIKQLADAPTYENIGFPGIGQGISIDAQITCSIEQFICENKKYLQTPLLYLLGSEMLLQKISSNLGSRVNYFTSGNLEQTQNTRELFEKEYVKSMKNAVRSLNIPDSGICFACNENAQSFQGSAMP